MFQVLIPSAPCRHRSPAAFFHLPNISSFHASAIAMEDSKVVVPSMGDSITEGTVASVEKQAGVSITFSADN